MTNEELTQFDERLIEERGLLYGTSKIVNFMSSDNKRRISVAITGSGSLLQEVVRWSNNGVTVDSIDKLATLMQGAVNRARVSQKL